MFKNLLENERSSSKTGFFKVDNGILSEIGEVPGNGSINNCIESLGFPTNHIRMIHTFNSDKINCLGCKVLSKEIILVLTKNPETKISYSDVEKEINRIDWSFEYSSLNIEDILQEGIDLKNFDLNFLKSVIDLKKDSEDIYIADQLGLYLQFQNDVLIAFTSSGWDNSATKWLNDLNPTMVRRMTEEAKRFHDNDIDTMQEVNKQAASILDIPHVMENEFIPLHSKINGNVNFYNLLITHYNKDCNIDEFIFMNKGRFRKINEKTLEAGNFVYSFNSYGKLESVIEK